MNFDLKGIEYEVTGELDLRGLMGDSSVRTYFQWVKIDAKIRTSDPVNVLKKYKKSLTRVAQFFKR